MPRIEVVVLQHNESALTVKCIESIRAQVGCEIFLTVIDQASEPEHQESVRSLGDRFIGNSVNRLIQPVWNDVLASSDYEVVGLINNDTYLADTCIARLVETLDQYPKTAWVSGAYQQGCDWPHCGIDWPPEVCASWEGQPEALNAWARTLTSDVRFWDRTEMTAFVMRPEVFREVGSFDYETFGCHQHDFDYGQRIQKLGYVLAVRRDAVFWHWQHRSLMNAVSDGTWNDGVSREESEVRLREIYPGLDVRGLKELSYPR
jgi:hypothetical protein